MENSLILLNLCLSLVGAWLCICRMTMMSARSTKEVIRFQYALWFASFIASGFSWMYDSPANLSQLLVTAAILAHLFAGWSAWRRGAPPYAVKA